jgi:aspartate aminotransferase
VVINSLSKTYAMTGWRMGYTAAPVEVIKAMTVLQSQSTSNPTSIAQAAAVAALDGPQACVDEMAREFAARRELVVRLLRQIPGVRTTMPGGAFYVFPDVSAFFGRRTAEGQPVASANDVAMYLLRQVAVASVPGEGFGAPAHIRLSYATSRQALEQGIGRMADALGRLR